MDTVAEFVLPIPIVSMLFLIAVLAAVIAYRARKSRLGVVLAAVAALLVLYAIVWTFTP